MPAVTRWFIKAGILYFLAGVSLALIAGIPAAGAAQLLLPVYWHMLVMGWLTQVIMGVSIWLFPRKYRDRPNREFILSWLAFWLLNLGLVLRFLTEPFLSLAGESIAVSSLSVLSASLQVLSVVFYIAEIGPRLRKGERGKRRAS